MSGLRLKQHTARVGGVTYSFNGLVELMAKVAQRAAQPDIAQQRLHPGRRVHRVVDVVVTGRRQPAVAHQPFEVGLRQHASHCETQPLETGQLA